MAHAQLFSDNETYSVRTGVRTYELTAEDHLGRHFHVDKWKPITGNEGQDYTATVSIYAPLSSTVATSTSTSLSAIINEEAICRIEIGGKEEGERGRGREERDDGGGEGLVSFHLIHPETVFKATREGTARMFWIQEYGHLMWEHRKVIDAEKSRGGEAENKPKEMCLELLFSMTSQAEAFERAYVSAQQYMATIHSKSRHQWQGTHLPLETELKTETEILFDKEAEIIDRKAVQETLETESEEESESEGSEEDREEDSSECSEISLPEYSDDDKPFQPFKFPSLSDHENMWKCPECTSPNPKSSEKCLCCEALGKTTLQSATSTQEEAGKEQKVKEEKKEQKQNLNSFLSSLSTGQTAQSDANGATGGFNFSTSQTSNQSPSAVSFSFGASTAASKSAKEGNEAKKNLFSFGAVSSSQQIAGSPEANTLFSFSAAEKKPLPKPPGSTPSSEETKILGQPKSSTASPYPPAATMRKVEQVLPSSGSASQPVKNPVSGGAAPSKKANASPYPPMESMKKVDQPFAKGSASDSKPETVKAADKPAKVANPYPPMASMQKVEQMFAKKATIETQPATQSPSQSSFSFSGFNTSLQQSPSQPTFNFNTGPQATAKPSSSSGNARDTASTGFGSSGFGFSSGSSTTAPVSSGFGNSGFSFNLNKGGSAATNNAGAEKTTTSGAFGSPGLGAGGFSSFATPSTSGDQTKPADNVGSGFSFSSFASPSNASGFGTLAKENSKNIFK